MNVDTLVSIVTVSGIIFLIISLLIVFLGKKVGEGGSQNLKISKHIQVRTNSVLMLIVIMVLFTLTPIGLVFYDSNAMRYIGENELNENYLKKNELSFEITGAIFLNWLQPAKNYDIIVKASNETVHLIPIKEEGHYEVIIDPIEIDKDYEIIWKKDNYEDEHFRFKFNSIRSGINLRSR